MNQSAHRILVIDEDFHLRKFINITLRAHGYEVIDADSGKMAVSVASTENPDLIIMDLSLPDTSGVNLVSQIREWSKVPIIVLSMNDYDEDNLAALDKQADDFLTKPFLADDLITRVESCIRENEKAEHDDKLIKLGKLKIDTISEVVSYDLKILALDNREYKIMKALAEKYGKIVGRRQLVKVLSDDPASEEAYQLSGYISTISSKLDAAEANTIKIIPEPKIGYRLIVQKL